MTKQKQFKKKQNSIIINGILQIIFFDLCCFFKKFGDRFDDRFNDKRLYISLLMSFVILIL